MPKTTMRSNAFFVTCLLLWPLLASVVPVPDTIVRAGAPPTGDWNINDAQAESNKDITMTGNITVGLGGTLTLDKVNLKMNSTSGRIFNITIGPGGKLIMKNCSIAPSDFLQRYRYNFRITAGATADIFDSTLAAIGEGNLSKPETLGLLVEASNVRFIGNTFTRTNVLYPATAILVGLMASPLIEENDISGFFAVGISFMMGSKSLVKNNTVRNNAIGLMSLLSQPVLEGNTFQANLLGVQAMQSTLTMKGNTLRGSIMGALGAESSDVTMDSDKFIDNTGDMELNASGLVAKRISISGAINGINVDHAGIHDVLIENSSIKAGTNELTINDSSVHLLNTTFNEAKVSITTNSGSLLVFWFLHVNVTKASGAKVPGATVTVKDSQDTTVFQGPTDPAGQLRWVQVEQYSRAGDKRTNLTPHMVAATLGQLTTNASVEMTASKIVDLVMDDIPPVIKVLQPLDGALLNSPTVAFKGNATDNEGVVMVEYKVSSGPWTVTDGIDPWNFTVAMEEGTHQVSVRATDIDGMIAVALVNVTIDTIAPTLIISKPANDTLTNKTQVTVEGRSDPDASLLQVPGGGKDNVTIAVDAQGRFSFLHNLTEGTNDIMLVAQDDAGNKVMRSVRVNLDTKPPALSVSTPADKMMTNSSKVMVAGTTEADADLTVNGLPVVVAANGSFSQELILSDGSYSIRVAAKDPAGNLAVMFRTVTVDTVKPNVDIDSPDDGLVTNATLISIKGRAQAQLVWVGIIEADTQPDPDAGWWDYNELYPLKEGQNVITVQAQDLAGNRGSATIKVIRDTVAPVINITEPVDGSKTKAIQINIVGTTEAGTKITLNGEPLDETDGTFSMPVDLVIGKNVINISARDAAGNVGKATVTIYREKKSTGPTALGGDNCWPIALIVLLLCIAVFLLAYNYSRNKTEEELPIEKPPRKGKKARVEEEE